MINSKKELESYVTGVMNSEVPSYSKVPEMSQYNANVFQNLVGHLNLIRASEFSWCQCIHTYKNIILCGRKQIYGI